MATEPYFELITRERLHPYPHNFRRYPARLFDGIGFADKRVLENESSACYFRDYFCLTMVRD